MSSKERTVSSPLSLDELTEEDFDDLVHEWETELREAGFDLSQQLELLPRSAIASYWLD